MEHRDQIKNELSSKEIFLQNSLVENEKPAIYSLEAEFAKAKKNWDLKPYLIFFGFIFLLMGITSVTVSYLEHQSKRINIDISDFEDLRLKEALSGAMEKEEKLREANVDLEGYQYALSMLIKDKKAAGCVIDPRQPQNVLIFSNQKVTSETVVSLYRTNGIYVGKLKLIPEKAGLRVEIDKVAKNQRVKPFDWFRIR